MCFSNIKVESIYYITINHNTLISDLFTLNFNYVLFEKKKLLPYSSQTYFQYFLHILRKQFEIVQRKGPLFINCLF